ncbi:hypothetical protein QJS66_00850 [Kocuria rhizophila]|nr:hypothetical protein QJS66_00850 [Kocuria rhizophila]
MVALRAMLQVMTGGQAAMLAPTGARHQRYEKITAALGPLAEPRQASAGTPWPRASPCSRAARPCPRRGPCWTSPAGPPGSWVGAPAHPGPRRSVQLRGPRAGRGGRAAPFGVEQRDALRGKAASTPHTLRDDRHAHSAHRGHHGLRGPGRLHPA